MTTREKTSALLVEFKTSLETIYGERLKGVFLYGSHARNQASPDSDVDVVIVLNDWEHYAGEVDRTGAVASELSLAYGLTMSRVFVRERDWLQGDAPFLANAHEEAIPA